MPVAGGASRRGACPSPKMTCAGCVIISRRFDGFERADGKGGLKARTVRYIHTIVHAGLGAAVRDGLLAVNPADKADPPSAKAAAAPEMKVWAVDELRAFLERRAQVHDELWIAWSLLAATGMRRGEALALRWGDVDFDGARLSVRRAAALIQRKGEPSEIVVGPPKSGKPRVVDVDPGILAALKAHKAAQGTLSLALARDGAYVLADLDGNVRSPNAFSKRFDRSVGAVRRALGDDVLKRIRLHDLRHTHAMLLLKAGVPVKVVSERLGHANAMITLGVYAHVTPGMQAEAAAKFGELLSGASDDQESDDEETPTAEGQDKS
jgi:integrase